MIFNKSITAISFLTLLTITSRSSMTEQRESPAAKPAPATSAPASAPAEIQMEGGIVGTGNEDDCKNSSNKNNCNDNVK